MDPSGGTLEEYCGLEGCAKPVSTEPINQDALDEIQDSYICEACGDNPLVCRGEGWANGEKNLGNGAKTTSSTSGNGEPPKITITSTVEGDAGSIGRVPTANEIGDEGVRSSIGKLGGSSNVDQQVGVHSDPYGDGRIDLREISSGK